jgi:hypothetical protein
MLSTFYKTDHGLYLDVWAIESIQFRNPGKDVFGLADIFFANREQPTSFNLTAEDMDTISYIRARSEY